MLYTRASWPAVLTYGSGSVSLDAGRWCVQNGVTSCEVEAQSVTEVRVHPGMFWSTLELVTDTGVVRFPGLAHRAAEHLHGMFVVGAVTPRVAEALAAWQAFGHGRYLNHHAWAAWQESHASTRALFRPADLQWLPPDERAQVSSFLETFDAVEQIATRQNEEYLQRELRECEALLDAVETNPLTACQRRAVITDEDNTLVIAGAGTGKTSVVVAKVAYIVKRLGVPPEQVLVLAYNRAAAAELQERVNQRVGVEVTISTFHALGSRIIGEAEGKKPALSRLAERQDVMTGFIEETLRGMLALDSWRTLLVRHLLEYLRPCKRAADFPDKLAYNKWLRAVDIKSMKGEQVRSLEECIIADWLFLNGIEYQYERDYQHDTADAGHRQYRPDFYLIEAGVYIEHFGVDRDGKTAPWIDAAAYRSGMDWKRDIHRRHGTRLVETFSYEKQEGLLTERLAERLAAIGVTPSPRAVAAIERTVGDRGVISQLARLLLTFLQHFKEGRRSVADISPAAGSDHRAHSFLRVFEHARDAYEAALGQEKAIDYSDMIGRAADHVEAGRYASPYRYVVVDEFQDMSRGRARLLRALLEQVPDRRLTCVGDDWQSIYRFSGADITHMTHFHAHFGHTASVTLDESFRFGRRLLQASAQFVQKNPAQLRKALVSSHDEGRHAIVIVSADGASGSSETGVSVRGLREVLARISQQAHNGRPSVFLLGRYTFSLPHAALSTLRASFPRLGIDFLTIHRSKGLQADFVVLLDGCSGRFGFPSEIADDPLLSMVLAEPDALEHAEERRLFYVALTRARQQAFILTRERQQSAFVEEVLAEEYAGLVERPPEWSNRVRCPECGGSLIRKKNGNTQEAFWGCVDWPLCEGSLQACTVCQDGALLLQGSVYRCNRQGCTGREEACPRCREGMLVRRPNKAKGTEFWACTKWKRDKTGCNFTRDVEAGGGRGRRSR